MVATIIIGVIITCCVVSFAIMKSGSDADDILLGDDQYKES
jgi:hypothetical protein